MNMASRSRSPSPEPMYLRSAAKRQRMQNAQASEALASARQELRLMLRYVNQNIDGLEEIFSFLDTLEKMNEESKEERRFVVFSCRCKAQLHGVREKEARVADEARYARYKDQVLPLLAGERDRIISMLHTMLPVYTAFANATDFADDASNKMLRHVVAAYDNFRTIETDEPVTLALVEELVAAVKPLFWRLDPFVTNCMHAKTFESFNPSIFDGFSGMILPDKVSAMQKKTVLVPSEDGSNPYYKVMRLMQLCGKTYKWHVHADVSYEWWFNYNWASICAKSPTYQIKFIWKENRADVFQFNKVAGKFVFMGTIERRRD